MTSPGVEFEPLGPVYVRGFAEPIPLVRAFATLLIRA